MKIKYPIGKRVRFPSEIIEKVKLKRAIVILRRFG